MVAKYRARLAEKQKDVDPFERGWNISLYERNA